MENLFWWQEGRKLNDLHCLVWEERRNRPKISKMLDICKSFSGCGVTASPARARAAALWVKCAAGPCSPAWRARSPQPASDRSAAARRAADSPVCAPSRSPATGAEGLHTPDLHCLSHPLGSGSGQTSASSGRAAIAGSARTAQKTAPSSPTRRPPTRRVRVLWSSVQPGLWTLEEKWVLMVTARSVQEGVGADSPQEGAVRRPRNWPGPPRTGPLCIARGLLTGLCIQHRAFNYYSELAINN